MKQLNGVVEVHGDNIEIVNHNNVQCATIEGPSTYDIYSYLKDQNFDLKLDLIKELCVDMSDVELSKISSFIKN